MLCVPFRKPCLQFCGQMLFRLVMREAMEKSAIRANEMNCQRCLISTRQDEQMTSVQDIRCFSCMVAAISKHYKKAVMTICNSYGLSAVMATRETATIQHLLSKAAYDWLGFCSSPLTP